MVHEDLQRARACQALCAHARLGRCWTTEGPAVGPTDRAVGLLRQRSGVTAHQKTLLRVAWALWDMHSDRGAQIGHVLRDLDDEAQEIVGLLIAAQARGELEEWLDCHEGEPVRLPELALRTAKVGLC